MKKKANLGLQSVSRGYASALFLNWAKSYDNRES